MEKKSFKETVVLKPTGKIALIGFGGDTETAWCDTDKGYKKFCVNVNKDKRFKRKRSGYAHIIVELMEE